MTLANEGEVNSMFKAQTTARLTGIRRQSATVRPACAGGRPESGIHYAGDVAGKGGASSLQATNEVAAGNVS